MRFNFKGKDFLTLMDFTREEIEFIIDVAMELKRKVLSKEPHKYLKGRVIGLLFEKPAPVY